MGEFEVIWGIRLHRDTGHGCGEARNDSDFKCVLIGMLRTPCYVCDAVYVPWPMMSVRCCRRLGVLSALSFGLGLGPIGRAPPSSCCHSALARSRRQKSRSVCILHSLLPSIGPIQ